MGSEDMTRLEHAVMLAEDKGGKSSLVLMEQAAFVVSIANRTVITAVESAQLKQSVFTKIDSTVIV